jgi:hypothetical protein
MSAPDNRRESVRILTDFSLILVDDKGEVLDDRAVAHDVSEKGFKAETQAELKEGQIVRYRLALRGQDIPGRARVVWCHRTDLSYWAGAQFLTLSWSHRRLIRQITSPSDVDWGVIADKAILALSILLGTILSWMALSSPVWRAVLPSLFPKAVAAIVMGFALRELLRPRR